MRLTISPAVQAQLDAMPKVDGKRMRDALHQVADMHPQRLGFVTELRGSTNRWRLRKGDWRAIYVIIGDEMELIAVEQRKEIYR